MGRVCFYTWQRQRGNCPERRRRLLNRQAASTVNAGCLIYASDQERGMRMVPIHDKNVENNRLDAQRVSGGDGASTTDVLDRQASFKQLIQHVVEERRLQAQSEALHPDTHIGKSCVEPAETIALDQEEDSFSVSQHEKLIQRM